MEVDNNLIFASLGFDRQALEALLGELGDEDRQILDRLFAAAMQHLPALKHSAHPLPYQVFLFSLLLEEHKRIKRLRDLLGDFDF